MDQANTSLDSTPFLVPAGTPSLRFDYYNSHLGGSSDDRYWYVYVLSGSNFETSTRIDGNQVPGTDNEGWQTAVLDLQAFQGQTIKLRFVTQNAGNSRYRLDNVHLLPLSTTTYTVVETNPPNYSSSTPDTVTVDAYGGAPLCVDFGDFGVDRYNSTVEALPTEIVADGVSPSAITVVLRDGNDNPLPGHRVEINAPGLAVTVTQPSAPTDALGRATGYVRSTHAPQSVLVSARTISDNVTLAQAVPITFTPGLPDPDRSTFTVSPASVVANGTDAATFVVTLRDRFGNPVPGKTVTVTVEGTDVDLSLDPAQTDALGQVSGALRSPVAQTATLHAHDLSDGIALAQSPVILFTSTDPQQSSVVAAPATLIADGSSAATITVSLRDQNGAP
ncbi:MAG: hypothetical protein GY842_05540, partial [bacterium]|nr:hypothetical protein [bacterium]